MSDSAVAIQVSNKPSGAADIEAAHRRVSSSPAWKSLRSPASTTEFYRAWLGILCASVSGARVGLLLIRSDDGAFVPASIWPDASVDPSYLSPTAERALVERTPIVDDKERANHGVHIAHPLLSKDELLGVVVIDVQAAQGSEAAAAIEKIAWSVGWPEALFWRQQSVAQDNAPDHVPLILDVLRAADQHERFEVAAVLVANRIASHLECERVTLGLVGQRGIYLAAMSHSANFDRKSELVVGLVAAMQEAFDQHDTVAFPAIGASRRRINVSHADFAERWKVGAIASVLMVAAGRPIGVLSLERTAGKTFDQATLDAAASVAESLGPVIELKHKQARLLAGRLFDAPKEVLGRLFGSERLSLKLLALAIALFIGVLVFWPGQFRISAKAVLEGTIQRAAVAPFDGFVAAAPLRAGDIVTAGTEVARLDDRDLLLEKLRWETERAKLLQRQRDSLAKHERTNQLVFGSQVEQAQSQLDLVLEKLKRARITAPIDGIIVSGDLSQTLGAPVQQGKVLFEIAPLDSYRLILQLDERDISFVSKGNKGVLLLTGAASQSIDLEITRLTSVATAEDGRNFFRVEASIKDNGLELRPGMEGIAKVQIGERSLLWIWTRPLIDRIRLFIWNWSP
jgi:multidrug efflux pump subunit AcrA (membrane-fusion protein)